MAPSDPGPRADDDRPGPSDDLPPTGEEAEAQRTQTVMPAIWAVLGLVAVAIFALALFVHPARQPPVNAKSSAPSAAAVGAAPPMAKSGSGPVGAPS